MTKIIASIGLAGVIFNTALLAAGLKNAEHWTGLHYLGAAVMIITLAYAMFAYKEE